jgi:2-dehydro-3-deoxyglucarate aldolase
MAQTNKVRDIVESGEKAVGAKVYSFDETMIELIGRVGLDYAWLDLEHHGPSPRDALQLERFARAAKAAGLELVIKHPGRNFESDFNSIHKLLEAGIRNFVVTQVEDAEQVRKVVEATRFEYRGDTGNRYAANGRLRTITGQHDEFYETEDEQVFVGVVIEQKSALENIDEILEVPELGFAMIGSGGLAASLGHAGNPTHPDCVEAEETILSAIDDHDVPMGFTIHNLDEYEGAKERDLAHAQRPNVKYPNIQLVQLGVDFTIFYEELVNRFETLEPQL